MRIRISRLAVTSILVLLLPTIIVLLGGTAAYPAYWGYKWTRQESGTTAPIHDVEAIDATHVWAVTGGGELLFYDGTSWSPRASGISEPLYAIDAIDNDHIWAVTYNGAILYYDGHSWEDQGSGTDVPLSSVSALDSTHVWACGGYGQILFYDGFSWESQTIDNYVSFESIYALDASHVWAVGGGLGPKAGKATSYFFDGSAWSEINTGAEHTLFDVYAMDAQHVLAVGSRGEIQFFDGLSWNGMIPQTDGILYGIKGLGYEAFAVGEGGAILYSDLTGWDKMETDVTTPLRSVSGLDPQNVWAVGDDGVILFGGMTKPPFEPTTREWGTDSIGVTSPATKWYLAEGSTGPGFETWVLVQNPNPNPTDVFLTINFMTAEGPARQLTDRLVANSRTTYNVGAYVPNNYQVSTKVESTSAVAGGGNGVIVERAVYGNNRKWAHESIGATAPATKWYLAEGSTSIEGGFETWVLVQNPNPTDVFLTVYFMTAAGPARQLTDRLAANSRRTYNVADYVPNNYQVSTKVESFSAVVDGGNGVIVERAMYGCYPYDPARERRFAFGSIGATAPANKWYLAEGCTYEYFETWVLVQNPNPNDVFLTVDFMTPEGPGRRLTDRLAANSRRTYHVDEFVGWKWEVSTTVESGCTATGDPSGVIVERTMFGFRNPPTARDPYYAWAHNTIGATAPANKWYLAEGSTGPGFETWVLVQNPNANDILVTLNFMTPTGQSRFTVDRMLPNSRKTFNLWEYVPNNYEVSTSVESSPATAGGGSGVIVERAMYGNAK